MSKSKRTLLTGVDGFLGTHLSRALLSRGDEVSGLIRTGLDINNENREITYHRGELLDPRSIAEVIRKCEPDIIYHLAAQTFVPRSFSNPKETYDINFTGTLNLLEAVRTLEMDPVVIFSSSAEEYGLVYSSEEQYNRLGERYSSYPPPTEIPELPVNENNPLRPLSPYGLSKVYGTSLMAAYHSLYGLKTVTARNFNIEGPGRGEHFVTSHIIRQLLEENSREIRIGNVNIFKDWSHVEDVVRAFQLLEERGKFGQVYNAGSERTNSILTFILLSMRELGYDIKGISSVVNGKELEGPLEKVKGETFGRDFTRYRVDEALLDTLRFEMEDVGIIVHTGSGELKITFDRKFFRPHDNPILMSDTTKISALGFEVRHSLEDIVSSQVGHMKDDA